MRDIATKTANRICDAMERCMNRVASAAVKRPVKGTIPQAARDKTVEMIDKAITSATRSVVEENTRMRAILIEYHNAESAYEAAASTERYGRYEQASKNLVSLAKELAGKKDDHNIPRSQ